MDIGSTLSYTFALILMGLSSPENVVCSGAGLTRVVSYTPLPGQDSHLLDFDWKNRVRGSNLESLSGPSILSKSLTRYGSSPSQNFSLKTPTHSGLPSTLTYSPNIIMGRVPKSEPKDGASARIPKPTPVKPQTDKATALKSMLGYRRASAWQIHRWPLRKHVIYEKSRVYLPRSYLAKDGMEIKVIWPGMDLNQFVHNHYKEMLGSGASDGGDGDVGESKIKVTSADFVTDDGVCPRK